MEKNTIYQATSRTFHLEGLTGYFNHKRSIKLFKNKMDTNVIKSHQCSLKRFHAVLIELNSEF